MTPQDFISRWEGSAAAELANSQSFLKELCALLGVEEPQPTVQDERENTYVFEKAVTFNNGDGTTSAGRVDLYRKGCFVLESKQGSERRAAEQEEALAKVNKSKKQKTGTAPRGTNAWEKAMTKARLQAERYAKALPDEWPPFLIVADVGHCFDVYADFSQSGKNYILFPDPQSYRIPLAKLAEERTDEKDPRTPRELLQAIWTDPHSLDPAKQAAKVTRELAGSLAELAKRLEQKTGDDGEMLYTPEDVAHFLMRCLFTMFAEDVRQKFNRRVVSLHLEAKNPPSILFAIPDHPWMDTAMSAAVRIAMTVGVLGKHPGRLDTARILIDTGTATVCNDRVGSSLEII